ncbi:type 2 isopentenyl-diphosphate Delta-isomerase [Aureimonas fodinaquatilis]|uniref:Isopentenyl-diphosphate delta-isomerase n=1 Tax=Aureimonas fodinaquatilis TaxID=2565783 RepID=A0A5B0E0V1_9HYPH|nr:type 2 isopentenyl-diphosphate Delta-isomerase [Aureimonas fodinaquatilis]
MSISRKNDHLDIVLGGHAASSVSSGFERFVFEHVALPEINMDEIELGTEFLGKRISAPLLVSSMTGGPERAELINANLATACEELGIAFAVGSQRVALETDENAGLGRRLRDLAPSIPLMANFGAAQLNLGYGREQAMRAVDMIGADALIIHLNPLQEAVQPEGDRNWRGLFQAIEHLAGNLSVPLAVKEVGSGISAPLARRLFNAGVSIIDVAGAGGTSWAAVEAGRAHSPVQAEVARAFTGWGQPTADAIHEVREACPDALVIGSGGVRDGVDVAKAIRLGADLAGQAAGTLGAATVSADAVMDHFNAIIAQLKVTCFCTGSKDLQTLKEARLRSARDIFMPSAIR